MDDVKLAVVIPAFSGDSQIRRCLRSLESSRFDNLQIILVDHGPTDKIRRWVRKEFPNVVCLRGSPELWWSGATNMGIRHAIKGGNDLIMLLNHDCYVKPDTISRLIQHVTEFPDAIVAPVQQHLRTNKRIFTATSCFLLGFPTIIWPAGYIKRWSKRALVPTRLIIGGRGVIIKTSIFNRIGLFDDENLPHYGADHDFYIRCRQNGISLLIATDSVVEVDGIKTAMPNSFRQFLASIKDRGSHRNKKDLVVLYKRYFPIPGVYYLGVALNLGRYFGIYTLRRLRQLVSQK